MPKKKHAVEQIIHKLREAEVLLSQGKAVAEVGRSLGITEQTYYLPAAGRSLAQAVRRGEDGPGQAVEGTGGGEQPAAESRGRSHPG